MTRGRKPLPEGERMVVLAVRVPQYIVDWLDVDAARDGQTRSERARDMLKQARDNQQYASLDFRSMGWIPVHSQ